MLYIITKQKSTFRDYKFDVYHLICDILHIYYNIILIFVEKCFIFLVNKGGMYENYRIDRD